MDTAKAPSELPATPIRSGSSMACSGLNAALRFSATRRICLAEWLIDGTVRLLRGRNGLPGVDRKKSIASTVPSVKASGVWGWRFSFSVPGPPGPSERPWVWGSQVSTT